MPPSLGLADAQADLLALDRLRPRLQRLRRLAERGDDSEVALGSDIMALSLEGYALLKVAGRNQGLEALRRELSGRFNKARADGPKASGARHDPLTRTSTASCATESRSDAAFRVCARRTRAPFAAVRDPGSPSDRADGASRACAGTSSASAGALRAGRGTFRAGAGT